MSTTGPVMTVTDELLAEIAQELNRCKFSDDDDGDESWPSIRGEAVSALTAELRRMRAENAELAKDAGRYRWMRDGAGYCETRDIPGMAPVRMDEYIDAAMESPK